MDGPYLDIKDAKGSRKVPLDRGPLTIGRNFTNLLVLEEPLASRFHAVIEKMPDGYRVRDLDSRNGTKLNGHPVRAALLNDGDVVSIGKTELRLVVPVGAGGRRAATTAGPRAGAGRSSAHARGGGDAAGLDPAPLEEFAELQDVDEPTRTPGPSGNPYDIPDSEVIVGGGEAPGDADVDDWEQVLRDRADSLADHTFSENDIALINARSVVAHAPRTSGGKNQPGGDTVTLLRLILLICFRSRASDIHVEPKSDNALVRARVDGTMVDLVKLDRDFGNKLASIIKVLGEIDIAQRNSVQEGRFTAKVPGGGRNAGGPRKVDYRVSFAPAMFGQKCVIRILDAANAPAHVNDLMLPPKIYEPIRRTIDQQAGMILVCGPTGSGKTTTLYAVLRDIDVSQRNVVTIEDPVEVELEGVTQIPVNDAQGNTFSSLLRSVLRQDPDAILVGEIRDADTARVAMQAAMTGHLVFSTVHSRDTVGAIYRLIDLGVEPYLVASGLNLVLAQRLVRQLCTYCKVAVRPTPQQVDRMAKFGVAEPRQIFQPKGCRRCLNTGFMGRRGVVELLNTTGELRDVILKSPSIQEIQKTLGEGNYVRLQETGYTFVAEGVTSFDEVERAVS